LPNQWRQEEKFKLKSNLLQLATVVSVWVCVLSYWWAIVHWVAGYVILRVNGNIAYKIHILQISLNNCCEEYFLQYQLLRIMYPINLYTIKTNA
jgi:hypothetical protein